MDDTIKVSCLFSVSVLISPSVPLFPPPRFLKHRRGPPPELLLDFGPQVTQQLALAYSLYAGAQVVQRISEKASSGYLRTLLIQGAKSAVMTAHKRRDRISQWLVQLTARVGWQKAVVAMANKNARILWAVLAKGRRFDPDHVPVKPEGPALAVPARAG